MVGYIEYVILEHIRKFIYPRQHSKLLNKKRTKNKNAHSLSNNALPVKSSLTTEINKQAQMVEIYRQDGTVWVKIPASIGSRFLLSAINKTK